MPTTKVLLVSATTFEMAAVIDFLDRHFEKRSFFQYDSGDLSVFPLVSGVGSTMTAYAIGKYQGIAEMSWLMQIGIAGALSRQLDLGQVVEINADRFADLGVEESDGRFTDVHELELVDGHRFPFSDGWILNDEAPFDSGLPTVRGLTVNTVHGSQSSIDRTRQKYQADVESMEGAAFMYASKMQRMPHIQIRAISNYVEPRNRANWRVDEAIHQLTQYTIGRLEAWAQSAS